MGNTELNDALEDVVEAPSQHVSPVFRKPRPDLRAAQGAFQLVEVGEKRQEVAGVGDSPARRQGGDQVGSLSGTPRRS